jgi:hypothetical protein
MTLVLEHDTRFTWHHDAQNNLCGARVGLGSCALFVWLISHQPAVLFFRNKSAINNQPTIFFSQNKSAPATSHQPNEQAGGKLIRRRRVQRKNLTSGRNSTTRYKALVLSAQERLAKQLPLDSSNKRAVR